MKKSKSVKVESIEDLRRFAGDISKEFKSKQVVLLFGPMGVGKTKFVQVLLEILDGRGTSSPTFSIHQTYDISGGKKVDHLDLYRLKDQQDLESTGFWDLFLEPEGLVIIEWADRLKNFAPLGWDILCIHMDFVEGTRYLSETRTGTGYLKRRRQKF